MKLLFLLSIGLALCSCGSNADFNSGDELMHCVPVVNSFDVYCTADINDQVFRAYVLLAVPQKEKLLPQI